MCIRNLKPRDTYLLIGFASVPQVRKFYFTEIKLTRHLSTLKPFLAAIRNELSEYFKNVEGSAFAPSGGKYAACVHKMSETNNLYTSNFAG